MAYFHCLIGSGSSGGGYELTVTCDADFAGTTITATDGVTTLTQTCPSASPYEVVFAIPNGGEWTISGIISGQTYSTAIDIPDSLELSSVPEGSTVLPTDDIQTWLACARIRDKSYTTLNEVLADSTTLLALMSDDNAVDYLVRSTTWASGITADSTAMTDIGANNYCANTLLSNSTWLNAICNSIYFESVLNVKVPTMTGNTTPSGECFASSVYSDRYAWRAFDKTTTEWHSQADMPQYVGYKFTSPVRIIKVVLTTPNVGGPKTSVVRGSNTGDADDWHEIDDFVDCPTANTNYSKVISNDLSYLYNELYVTESNYVAGGHQYANISELQFYGREDV